ncbi:MAG: AAA family ATPase [Bacteroidota bacterium]
MKRLPIGIQSFEKLIGGDYKYVDKTAVIHKLVVQGSYHFLSRPRRFGKSLLISTLKELFLANRSLFDGLWIADHWNWNRKHPIIHISFSSIGYKTLGLEVAINTELERIATDHDIVLESMVYDQKFRELIRKLSETEKVVVLIDEYDKPIIDYLDNLEQAKQHQNILKNFYSIIKDSDPHLRFLLITGVSKFSKVSIFSELNNLNDISIDANYATLTGYTQAELEHYFEEYIQKYTTPTDRVAFLDKVRTWYNGYSWDGKTFVYNPFSILNFFQKNQFQNFWFATGTPTFLIKLMKERNLVEIENVEIDQSGFESHDLAYVESIPLLFQTGYLTIKEAKDYGIYLLDYPNKEVKDSLLRYLIGAFRYDPAFKSTPIVVKLMEAFVDGNVERIMEIINALFKSIPSHIFIKEKEAYYHSLVYLIFQYLGQFIEAEVHTSDGRIDAVVQTDERIYLLEFKLDQSAEAAMAQIKAKKYEEKYQLASKKTIALGINFSSATKSVEGWLLEEV